MADVLSFNLTRDLSQEPKAFKRPDMSTKLKLLGVEVASFGDFFADRDGPKTLPERYMAGGHGADGNASGHPSPVKALTYKDPFGAVYKKYLFTPDGKYLLGGMMIGDTSDYIKLNQMVKNQKELDVPPSEFILGQKKADDGGVDDLYDSAFLPKLRYCPA
jgi:nitrite reductase (NAD(P)H)